MYSERVSSEVRTRCAAIPDTLAKYIVIIILYIGYWMLDVGIVMSRMGDFIIVLI